MTRTTANIAAVIAALVLTVATFQAAITVPSAEPAPIATAILA